MIESVLFPVVESSSGKTKGQQTHGRAEFEEECFGGGGEDTGPAVDGQGEGEEVRDQGRYRRKCGSQGAGEGGGEAPQDFGKEQNIGNFCEAKKAVHHDEQVDGCLNDFLPHRHEDSYGDQEEEDAAGDPKNLQCCILLL